MLLWIHDSRCEAKLISTKFLMLGDDLSVWDFLSSMTFPWLLMIFQSSMTFHDFSRIFYFARFSRPCGNPESMPPRGMALNKSDLNSYDAGDGIFRLWGSIPCLLMPWLLKSPEHQQAWYWICRTDNMYCSTRVNFIYLGQAKPKRQFKKKCEYIFCDI